MCMPDSCIPKQVFCGQLTVGSRPQSGPVTRYKDTVKENMKKMWNELIYSWQRFTRPPAWTSLCSEAVTKFEDVRVAFLQHKRAVRKQEAQPLSNLGTWPCDHCSRIGSSRIRLYTHQITHRWQGQSISRLRRRSPCVCVCVCVYRGKTVPEPILILLEQEAVSGSGISWAICKSAPCPKEITMPAPTAQFFTDQHDFTVTSIIKKQHTHTAYCILAYCNKSTYLPAKN